MLESNVTLGFVELTVALLTAAFVGALAAVTVFGQGFGISRNKLVSTALPSSTIAWNSSAGFR